MEKENAGPGPAESTNQDHTTQYPEQQQSRRVKLSYLHVSTNIARSVGVKEALIFAFIEFWLSWKIRRYGTPKDGIPKVYFSYQDFTVTLPYSERSIRNGVNALTTNGLISRLGFNPTHFLVNQETATGFKLGILPGKNCRATGKKCRKPRDERVITESRNLKLLDKYIKVNGRVDR